uniref:Uncharacterized protein n=1 Tax=Picea glauca TaxID=3330 RepID=A0A101LXH8_PICGL|nr:hypothetical protein ABT39_MTgene6178 [Picea glauca]
MGGGQTFPEQRRLTFLPPVLALLMRLTLERLDRLPRNYLRTTTARDRPGLGPCLRCITAICLGEGLTFMYYRYRPCFVPCLRTNA